MQSILIPELMQDEIQAIVQIGRYNSEKEAIQHALEVLLIANPFLRLNTAIELYRKERVTLSRAAEIAQHEIEAFKDVLSKNNVAIWVDETAEEIQRGPELIRQWRAKH